MDKLNLQALPLQGAYIITPNSFTDERGSFSRVFCAKEMEHLTQKSFAQVNHSITSQKGTVRGMHFQYPPFSEIKMVKCIKGAVYDVIIDIRSDSPTFLKSHAEILDEQNMKMIYIPEGFAHGFQTLENNSELLYFHTEFYNPTAEGALNICDPLLNIKWPLDIINISKKDEENIFLDESFKGLNIGM